MTKSLYVEVAAGDYGIDGRPTNTTRIAILTGLDRKTIKQIRDESAGDSPRTEQNTDRITRVLSGWHEDADFLHPDKTPRQLSLSGVEPNLRTLLMRYGGDVQPTAMLKELRRVGVIDETAPGIWQVLQRHYLYLGASPEAVSRGFLGVSDVANSLHHNLYLANDKNPRRFERRVTSSGLPRDQVPAFREFVNRQGQQFLEELDAWLMQHEQNPQSPPSPLVRVGLGMYWIEDQNDEKSKKTVNYG